MWTGNLPHSRPDDRCQDLVNQRPPKPITAATWTSVPGPSSIRPAGPIQPSRRRRLRVVRVVRCRAGRSPHVRARGPHDGAISRSGRRRGSLPKQLFGGGGDGVDVVIPVRQVTASMNVQMGSSRKGKHATSIIDEEDQVDGLIALAYRSPEPLQERRRAQELDAQQRGLHRRDGPCLVGRDRGPRTKLGRRRATNARSR